MTDIHTIRRKAADARRLLADEALQETLSEIEAEATRLFLASRGDPVSLTAAYEKARAVQTLLVALQARIDAQSYEDKREQKRGPHD